MRHPITGSSVLSCLSLAFAVLALPSLGIAGGPNAAHSVPEGLSATEWASVRQAYDAGRHATQPCEGGYQARNPGQRWLTRFDGRGFETEPDKGGWTWGLELLSYGFAGVEFGVINPERVSVDDGRVAYTWGATLEEWYVNDTRGLEHGYTVHSRPTCGSRVEDGALTFTLAMRGGLQLRPDVGVQPVERADAYLVI
jgi:hypothetical protein